MRLQLRTLVTAMALSLALLAPTASTAGGKGAAKKGDAQKQAKHATQPSPFQKQIADLHAINLLLNSANHNYKGHRAHAVKEISHAIHNLQEGYAHPKNGKGGKKAKVKAVHEPQQLSDAQLRDAMAAVAAIQQQVAGGKTPGSAKAVTHLGNAINELKIALTIK